MGDAAAGKIRWYIGGVKNQHQPHEFLNILKTMMICKRFSVPEYAKGLIVCQ
jgi:hypothetical protein